MNIFKNKKATIIDDMILLFAPIVVLIGLILSGVISIHELEQWDVVISVGLFAGMILLLFWEKHKSIPIRVR